MDAEDTGAGQAQHPRRFDVGLRLLREGRRANHADVRGREKHDEDADRHPVAAADHARDDDREERDGKREQHLAGARHARIPGPAPPRGAHPEDQTGHHRPRRDDERTNNRRARTGNRQGEDVAPHLVGAQQVAGRARRGNAQGDVLVQRAGHQHRGEEDAHGHQAKKRQGEDHGTGDASQNRAQASSQGARRQRHRHHALLPSSTA